jgi:hypothetical protein
MKSTATPKYISFGITFSSPLEITQIIFNKKLYEELIAYYSLVRHGSDKNNAIQQFYSCVCGNILVFYRAVVYQLPSLLAPLFRHSGVMS